MQDNRGTNGNAAASLAMACVSMACCVQWSVSLLLAVLAIVFGILGLRDENPKQEDAAIAGIVVGVVGVVMAVLVAVLVIRVTHNFSAENLEESVTALNCLAFM